MNAKGHVVARRHGRPIAEHKVSSGRARYIGYGKHRVARVLVDEANELRQTSVRLQKGDIGQFRIGMGSGPGAMLMATNYPKAHIEISRGSTTLLVQAFRERLLDALGLDIRSLPPSADLKIDVCQEMAGAFMCRPGHPMANKTSVTFAELRRYPVASTPLSDEVARILMERFGLDAHRATADGQGTHPDAGHIERLNRHSGFNI